MITFLQQLKAPLVHPVAQYQTTDPMYGCYCTLPRSLGQLPPLPPTPPLLVAEEGLPVIPRAGRGAGGAGRAPGGIVQVGNNAPLLGGLITILLTCTLN